MFFGSHESERISLIRHYSHAFKGFSAMLTENEASVLAGNTVLFYFVVLFDSLSCVWFRAYACLYASNNNNTASKLRERLNKNKTL